MIAGGARFRVGGSFAALALACALFLSSASPALGAPIVHQEVAAWHVSAQVGPRTFALRTKTGACSEYAPIIEAVEVDYVNQPNGLHRAVVTVRDRWETTPFEGPVGFGPRYPCETQGEPEYTLTLSTRLRHTRLYDASFYPHPERGICPEGVKRWTPAGMAICNQLDQPG